MPIKSLKAGGATAAEPVVTDNGAAPAAPAPTIIPTQNNLIDDLLGLDLGTPMPDHSQSMPTNAPPMGAVDLLSGGLDSLLDMGTGGMSASPAPQMNSNPMGGGMMDLLGGVGAPPPQQAPPQQGLSALGNLGIFGGAAEQAPRTNKQLWCNPTQCMGLEVNGEFKRVGDQVTMEMDISNKVQSHAYIRISTIRTQSKIRT